MWGRKGAASSGGWFQAAIVSKAPSVPSAAKRHVRVRMAGPEWSRHPGAVPPRRNQLVKVRTHRPKAAVATL